MLLDGPVPSHSIASDFDQLNWDDLRHVPRFRETHQGGNDFCEHVRLATAGPLKPPYRGRADPRHSRKPSFGESQFRSRAADKLCYSVAFVRVEEHRIDAKHSLEPPSVCLRGHTSSALPIADCRIFDTYSLSELDLGHSFFESR